MELPTPRPKTIGSWTSLKRLIRWGRARGVEERPRSMGGVRGKKEQRWEMEGERRIYKKGRGSQG